MLMDETKMLASLNLDIEACNNFQEKEVVLKKFYENRILPALEPRGLIARHSLHDKPGIALHQEFKSIASEPKYITSLELTVELISMPEKFWTRCFDFLCEQRCFITENWSEPLGVSIGIFVFDRTMSFDGSHVYRGECDASYYKGKGQACCAIWNSKNELLSSILVKKFDCHTSCMAEVIAMWILLKEAMRMGLQNSSFQACSDSSQVYKILCGTLLIEIEPNDNDGAAKVNKLLKFMRRYFNNLLPRWESREKLFLVDGIMRKGNVAGNEGNEDAVGQSSVAWKNSLVRRMAYYLTGNPVFKLTRKKSKFIKGLNTQRSNPLDIELEEACYVEVDEEHKIDATWHITSALRPGRLYIIMKDLDSRVDCTDELKHLFGKFVSRYDEEGHSLFTIDLEETRIPTGLINETHKSLMIIFDATIAKEEPEKILGIRDLFTVFLTTESEGYLVSKLQKLSPLSFVSFYKGSSAPKKNEDDKRVHEDHNVDDMPCGPDEESQDS
ncbi:hypothetical protein PAHAL_7G143800 [Panicum hallii]|uniref:RNase H type-1 domain-containing protein n=1 Tax=Panicum hallii TaxID=206008 RepID=A0A2S3I6G4_9POAL|nr:hypothetical protein PAHAL_7G143800 [Panicum hallii]